MEKLEKISLVIGVFLLITLMSWHFLPAYQTKKVFFETEVPEVKKEIASVGAVSFISPHHLVAEKLIENIFQKTAEINKNVKIKRIILFSPDHGNLSYGWGIISQNNWSTVLGEINSDSEATEILLKEKDIFTLNEPAFEDEHGIKNLLPFVKKYFGEAEIVPILLKEGLPADKIKRIGELFIKNFNENTIIILSADFSHSIGKTASEMHDQKSLKAMENFDYEKIKNLDIDCRSGLAILERYSEALGFQEFNLLENSNSSSIYGQNFGEENTSYITGYFSPGKKSEKNKSADILFLGDFMLDREMRTLIDRKGINWPTEKIQRLFWSQDLNVLNLESPLTEKTSVSIGSSSAEKRHFIFTSALEQAKLFFKAHKINIANLGNNHIQNFGKEGLNQTKSNLKNLKIDYFGDPSDKNSFLIKEVNGLKLAFVNYNQFSRSSSKEVSEKIKDLKRNTDFVIVYAHWGNEYQSRQNERQQKEAHEFLDSGADLIVGSHPHVIQPVEIYKNKAIFYSLGNFVFDQYFSEDVKKRLTLGISISKEKSDFYLIPLYAERTGQIVLSDRQKTAEILSSLANNSIVDQENMANIKTGRFTILNQK